METYASKVIVKACLIGSIEGRIITPKNKKIKPFEVSDHYIAQHSPHAGGYFVCHGDTRQEFMTAVAFDEMYEKSKG